jgi:hypothetical protein
VPVLCWVEAIDVCVGLTAEHAITEDDVGAYWVISD